MSTFPLCTGLVLLGSKRQMFFLTRKTNVFAGIRGRGKENMYIAKSERKEKKRNVPKGQK